MKTKLSILFLLLAFPLFLFAQTKISGRVLDKETHEPISNVVVYTNVGTNITQTDNDGCYNLIVNQSESVYFKQLAYDFFTCSSDSLLLNPNIYLTQNIIHLNEVVISPENAQTLLNKAIRNLYARLQKNKAKFYILHIEEATDTGGDREAYASVKAELTDINKKNGKLDWNINLVQLDKKTTMEDRFRPKKLHIARPEFFPQDMAVNSELNKYICKFYENEDEQIIIKTSPKHLDKEHYRYRLYTINKQDTILTEYISQSFPNSQEITTQKFLSISYQILDHFSSLKFAQDESTDSYYLKEVQNIGTVKMTIKSLATVFTFKINSKEISLNPVNSTKKIKPYDYELFEADFPNTPCFWKQYINP